MSKIGDIDTVQKHDSVRHLLDQEIPEGWHVEAITVRLSRKVQGVHWFAPIVIRRNSTHHTGDWDVYHPGGVRGGTVISLEDAVERADALAETYGGWKDTP